MKVLKLGKGRMPKMPKKYKPKCYSDMWLGSESSIMPEEDQSKAWKAASLQKAVTNYVKIVCNKEIPVKFSSGYNSYTDGSHIVIAGDVSKKSIDTTIGLALHEASHIAYTDFSCLKNTNCHSKNLLNLIEDRRIDNIVFKSSPGYKGYYHTLYAKYFFNDQIGKGLRSTKGRDVNWESYMFRVVNIFHKDADLTALPKLKEIKDLIDINNIGRLKNTQDALDVANAIYDLISIEIANTPKQPESIDSAPQTESGAGGGEESQKSDSKTEDSDSNNQDSEDTEDQAGNDNGSQDVTGGGQGSDSENSNTPDGNSPLELTAKEREQLENLLDEQRELLSGNVAKKKMAKQTATKVNNIANLDFELGQANYRNTKIDCVIIKTFNQKVIDSGIHIIQNYRLDSSQLIVNKGLVLGQQLGRKLQVRNYTRDLKYTRLDKGKIDRRLINQLGYDNYNVFNQIVINSHQPVDLHISIDASGSMSGRNWEKSQICAIAIAKAASMIQNIRVCISYRFDGGRPSIPQVLIAYDSKKDKITKIQSLFKYLHAGSLTPEGLAIEPMIKYLTPGSNSVQSYFLNFSDGMPQGRYGKIQYSGSGAIQHTAGVVKRIKAKGIKVISYFIGSYTSQLNDFREMYGVDAQMIDVNNVVQVAKSLNAKFAEDC